MDIGDLTATLIGCVVLAATVALTAWRLDVVSQRKGAADDYFWIGFGGLAVVTGAGVVAGTAGALGAVLAVGIGVVSAIAAAAWLVRRYRRRQSDATDAAWEGLHRRHDAAVQRWTDYEVDPAKAIDYPGMHDPSNPEVQPIVRALRAARQERTGAEEAGGGLRHPPLRYTDAVCNLEHAVDAAEQALGVSGPPRPPIPGGRRVDLESLPAGQFRRGPGR